MSCNKLLAVVLILASSPLSAEIVTDGALGPPTELIGPDFEVGEALGQRRGNNLFHSFQVFNLSSRESATFSGSENIRNVLARVTGGTVSSIDGVLSSTLPHADFYFINPAGIVFGPNARLNLPASFHAASADAVVFEDGASFDATHLENSSLTVAAPSAFGFHSGNLSILKVEQSPLAVKDGHDLSLAGHEVRIDRAEPLQARSGEIRISSETAGGKISLHHSFLDARAVRGGKITIRGGNVVLDNSLLSVDSAESSGGILIESDELTLANGSWLSTTTYGDGRGGDIQLKVGGRIELSGANQSGQPAAIFADSGDRATPVPGNAGNVIIEAENLVLKDGALLTSNTFGAGKGGEIRLEIKDRLILQGVIVNSQNQELGSQISARTFGEGQGGSIQINAGTLEIHEGGRVISLAADTGAGGVIHIHADEVMLDGHNQTESSIILAASGSPEADGGNAGEIQIHAKRLRLGHGARINSDTFGGGKGGRIDLRLAESLRLSGESARQHSSIISASARGLASGTGGSVNIVAPVIILKDGAQIGTSGFGRADGGSIELEADSLLVSGRNSQDNPSAVSSASLSDPGGEPGSGHGRGGRVSIQAQSLVVEKGALLTVYTETEGQGGHLRVNAGQLQLSEQAEISAGSEGGGDAGSLNLILGAAVKLENSIIKTETRGADGGAISLSTPAYVYLRDSQISTSVFDQNGLEAGNGGDIDLQSQFVLLDNGGIFARAVKGRGGNIHVETVGIYPDFLIETNINASSELGIDGVITLDTPGLDTLAGLFVPPGGLPDHVELQTRPCAPPGMEGMREVSHLIFKPINLRSLPEDLQTSRLLKEQ